MSPLATALPACLATLALTPAVRRLAIARGLLDVPNERSSHTRPTPRGGGLAIVAVVLIAIAWLALAGRLPARIAAALLGGGAVIALVGWLDDRRSLPTTTRLLAHAAAAAWAVWLLGGLPALTVGSNSVSLGWFGAALALVAIVWAVNLTNFMDGIDGLAATEAATVSLTGAALLVTVDPSLAAAAAVTGGAALGFLPWNWQRARIFLGDVGSGFLGYVLAILALASERSGAVPVIVWLILYAAFAVDGTLTVVRRAARGERWYEAHRSHAYQRAVQAGWTHARVALAVFALNVVLGLLGCLAVSRPQWIGPAWLGAALVCGAAYAGVERLRPMGRPAVPGVDNPPA